MIAKNLPAPQINPAWDTLMQQQMRTNFAKCKRQTMPIQDHYRQVTAGMVQRAQIAMTQLQDQTNAAMAQDRATQSAIDRRPHQSPCIPRRPERKMIFSKFDSFAIQTHTSLFSFRPN